MRTSRKHTFVFLLQSFPAPLGKGGSGSSGQDALHRRDTSGLGIALVFAATLLSIDAHPVQGCSALQVGCCNLPSPQDQKAELEEYMDHSRRLQVSVNETYYSNTIASLQATDYGFTGAIDSAWLCLCGALVMFMHAGFAMLETGSCRAKNASNVLMKNLVNVCVGTLGWWSLGWAFAYGAEAKTNGFIGASGFFGLDFYTQDATTGVITPVTCNSDGCQSTMLSWFFQWAFCTAGATIVSGGVAERVKSPTYAAYAFCMTTFIYPVIVAWSWGGGWLNSIFDVGYMDFAGSGIVHLTGGVSALAGTVVLGPRSLKQN